MPLNAFLQFLAGKENSAFDGAERQFEFVGDFLVFVAVEVHQKRNFDCVVKHFDEAGEFFYQDVRLGLVAGGMAGGVEQKLVLGVVENGVRLDFLAVIIDENVFHDGESPSLEVRSVLKFLLVGDGAKGCFLIQIFRVFGVFGEVVGKTSQHRRQGVELAGEIYGGHDFVFLVDVTKVFSV